MLSVLWVLSCSKNEIIFICVWFCLNTCIMRVVLPVYELGQMSRLDLSCPISSKFQPTTNGYNVTINILHRVGMSNCAHFGFEFTEKPTKNQFSELQTVKSDSKFLA